MKYRVLVPVIFYDECLVEADNETEALEIAYSGEVESSGDRGSPWFDTENPVVEKLDEGNCDSETR